MNNFQKDAAVEIVAQVKIAIENITTYIRDNNFRLTGSLEFSELNFSSISRMKKLRKSLSMLNKKMSIRRTNHFLYELGKNIPEFKATVKISEKEHEIKLAKKEWKKAKEIALDLLTKYKDIKGDFYK